MSSVRFLSLKFQLIILEGQNLHKLKNIRIDIFLYLHKENKKQKAF